MADHRFRGHSVICLFEYKDIYKDAPLPSPDMLILNEDAMNRLHFMNAFSEKTIVVTMVTFTRYLVV